jgi:hypothetical protein
MSSTALATPTSAPSNMVPCDLDQGRMYLDHVHTNLTGVIKRLSPAQWNFKPAPDRWSIAENVDHVEFVQGIVLGRVRDLLPTAPASAPDRDYRAVDAIVLGVFPHRFARFNAPEPLLPTSRFKSPQDALPRLAENTARLTAQLELTPDLRGRVLDAPPLKASTQGEHTVMDGYQWLMTAAAHTERHTHQILELMADPNFPEN